MKIPRTSEHVEIELLPGPPGRHCFDSSIALRVTANVNGRRLDFVEVMRPEYLDQDGYGKSLFEKIARDIGRKVLFG